MQKNCQQMKLIMKYQKKDNKLLMNKDYYNHIITEYQKIANLIDASNQPSKFKTKNWVEINEESRGTYSVNS